MQNRKSTPCSVLVRIYGRLMSNGAGWPCCSAPSFFCSAPQYAKTCNAIPTGTSRMAPESGRVLHIVYCPLFPCSINVCKMVFLFLLLPCICRSLAGRILHRHGLHLASEVQCGDMQFTCIYQYLICSKANLLLIRISLCKLSITWC